MQTQGSTLDNILNVAESLFRTKGYHATSVNEIVDLCGINKATLYHYFVSKEALALRVMDQTQECFDNYVFSCAYDETMPASSRLKKMNTNILEFLSIDKGGCLFTNLAIEQLEFVPTFVMPVRRYFETWTNAYRTIFSLVHGAEAARLLAHDFVSDLTGALIMMRVSGNNTPLLRLFARSYEALETGQSAIEASPVVARYFQPKIVPAKSKL